MAIAIRTDSSLSATITQTNLYDAIKTAFSNAGYPTPYDDYVSGTDRILVYEWINDNTKTRGTTYLRVRITSALAILQQLYSSWNTANKTGTNGNVEVNYGSVVTGTPINFVSLNGSSEYKFIFLLQSNIFMPLGMIAPTNKPDWWDLNAWNYGFIFTSTSMNIFRSSGLTPFSTTDYDTFLNNSRLSVANPHTLRRDILTGIVFLSQSSVGAGCRTSDDLASVSGNGSSRYDTLNIFGTTQQFLIINPTLGGLAIRVQ